MTWLSRLTCFSPYGAQWRFSCMLSLRVFDGGDLVLKWVQVCVGSVWADKSVGRGRGVNGLKSADKLPLETRCHISALAFTSKRRLSEPPVSSRFAAVCSMCVLLWEICSVDMQEASLSGLSCAQTKELVQVLLSRRYCPVYFRVWQ